MVVRVPTSPLRKYRNETAPTEIPSCSFRNNDRNGLNIVDASPVTAMLDIRNQKCRSLGMLERWFRFIGKACAGIGW